MAHPYTIGFGERDVTPPLGSQLAGFDARVGVADSVHDPLHSRATVICDANTKIALVSVEVIGVSRSFADSVSATIEQKTGIPAAHVVIACTHTHCGPVTMNHFFNQGQPLDEDYLSKLADGIVESVVAAHADVKPRVLRTGMATVPELAVNRRTVDGQPVDSLAGVMAVEELDGSLAGVLVSYACHTTVLGPNTLAITADFPYFTGVKLKQQFGQHVHVAYFNGAEGDVSIGHKSDLSAVGIIAPFRTFEKSQELGERLADAVSSNLGALQEETGPIQVLTVEAPLPLKTYAPFAEMKERRIAAGQAVVDAQKEIPAGTPPSLDFLKLKQAHLFARIEEYYELLLDQTGHPATLSSEVTAIRIGDTAIVTFPGEMFVQIGINIRAQSTAPKTMFFGLTNDYIGYVPTPEANASLGYEVVASRVTPEASLVLEDECAKLIGTLFAEGAGAQQ